MTARAPSVTRQTCDRYTVTNGYDSATIAIVEWAPRQDHTGAPMYGGEILVNSSFGSYCNSWSHCGRPFKRFLAGLDFHYFMKKCRGADAEEFDGEGSFRLAQERLIAARRDGSLSAGDAREAWDAMMEQRDEAESSTNDFVRILCGLDVRCMREPWEWITTRPTPDTVGFWRDLWPHFVAALKAEAETPPSQGGGQETR